MTRVQSAAPQATASTPRTVPEAVLDAARGAQFPAALGDPASFIVIGRLDAQSASAKTVSHVITAAGIAPYKPYGQSISAAIQGMNQAATPGFSMSAIRRDFISFDMNRLAGLSPADRAEAMAALGRLSSSLGVTIPATTAAATDSVERRRASTSVPGSGPATAGALSAPGASTREPLPDHPALAGTSPQWRSWLQRGDHRMQTVEALLGARPESFEAGLDEVQKRFSLGQDGHPANLEQAVTSVQRELGAPFASAGTPDGKAGSTTSGALADARDTVADQLTTPEGRADIRAQLAGKPNLIAALVPPEADVAAPESAADEDPAVAAVATDEAPAALDTAAAPTDAALDTPAVPTDAATDAAPADAASEAADVAPATQGRDGRDFAELARLRTAGDAGYGALRDSVLAQPPAVVAESIVPAMAADPALANELVAKYLDANASGVFTYNGNNPLFARGVASVDPYVVARLSPENLERLSRSLAPVTPNSPFSTSYAPPDLSPYVASLENAYIAQSQSAADLTKSSAAHIQHLFDRAEPGVVADAYKRFDDPGALSDLANYMTRYLQNGDPKALDARVSRAAGVLRALRERGIEGPTVDAFTSMWNWTIGSKLTNRVLEESKL